MITHFQGRLLRSSLLLLLGILFSSSISQAQSAWTEARFRLLGMPPPTGTLIRANQIQVNDVFTFGNGNAFVPFTFSNHNAMYWSGPGATPTVDQAVTACGANPCVVHISPTYTGAESANLTTTSVGYKVYSGANNVTIMDFRAGDSGVGNPTGTPLYPITYGGRSNGELVRASVNNWCSTPTDSCVGLADYMWFQGTFPTNGGALMGSSNLAVLHDSVTVGSSSPVSPVVGADAEMWLDATSIDRPVPYAKAYSGQVVINRANSLNRTTVGTAYHAVKCRDDVGNLINTCYGFDAGGGQAGVNNWGYHSADSWLTEINTSFDFTDAGNTVTTTSMSGTTATYNTSGTCVFTTGQKVTAGGIATVSGGDYNGTYVVLTPGCNGGSSFTATLPFSNLAASSGGIVRGQHKGTQWLSSDSSVTYLPMLDSVGWKWRRNSDNALIIQIIPSTASILSAGTIGCTGSGNCFLGASTFEFAGILMKEGGAVGGVAGDTVCGGVTATHTLNCSYNNDGAAGAGFPVSRTIANSTSTMTAGAITAATCQTAITTAATGVATTDSIEWSYATAPTLTTDALLTIAPYVTSGNVNFTRCNPTNASITGTAIVINWRVIR